jgi:16S rRNA (cytidine1402-2'-O)-methyltransferase
MISVERPIYLCRELTKIYEEILIGTPEELLARCPVPRGEFTLVVPREDPASVVSQAPPDLSIVAMFGQITELSRPSSKREAARMVAERLSLTTREVYAALERSKFGQST